MTNLELAAIAFTVLSVLLTVVKNVWLYPTGIVGTILYLGVFYDAQLYSSTWLQVFFTFVQFYGWWFWLRGLNGGRPDVTTTPAWVMFAGSGAAALAAYGLAKIMGGANAYLDALVACLSVFAQVLLDRKKIENWVVWCLVDLLSVGDYYSQGLTGTAILYVGLLLMAIVGLYAWMSDLSTSRVAVSS